MTKEKQITIERAFTLIEMLVVIALIGILAALALASFGGTQKQARDTERKSDLRQYQTLLEEYASKNNGIYPSYTTSGGTTLKTGSAVCIKLGLTSCPADPKDTSPYIYKYISNGTGAGSITATTFQLWTGLEGKPATTYWVLCSDGKVGEYSGSIGATCPL